MKEDHANMPGMSEQPKTAEQGKKSAKPEQEAEAKRSGGSAQPDKAKAPPAPGKP